MTTPAVVPIPQGATIGSPSAQPNGTPNPSPADSAGLVPIPAGAVGPGVPKPSQQTTAPIPDSDLGSIAASAAAGPFVSGNNPLVTGVIKGAGESGHTIGRLINAATGDNISWLPASFQQPGELESSNAGESAGKVGESLAEFMLGDEALKGLSIAERLGMSMKVMKLAQTYPTLARILDVGLNAIRGGAVGGVTCGLKQGPAGAATGAALGAGAEIAAGTLPGVVKQVIGGKNIAQPEAAEALRTAGGSISPTAAPEGLRETLTAPINSLDQEASSLYQKIDSASGTNFKTLADKLRKTNAAIRASVDDAEEARLELRRGNIQDAIDQAKTDAAAKGVDPAILDQADASFKRMSALSDVQGKVFQNPSIVSGNVAHGTPEVVNVDQAIRALQKLQDNTEYGAPRLEQALGKQGAKQLLDSLYDAQRQGVKAVRARWIAGIIGGVATGAAGRKVLGAAISATQ